MSIEKPDEKIEILPEDFQKKLQNEITRFGEEEHIGVMRTYGVEGEWKFTLGKVTMENGEPYFQGSLTKQASEAFMNRILAFGELPEQYNWRDAITYDEEGAETVITLDFPTLMQGT